jgi:hypothetical protein
MSLNANLAEKALRKLSTRIIRRHLKNWGSINLRKQAGVCRGSAPEGMT